ncbi:MAG TPA: hypothetical protein PLS49_08245 [Candidatus Woesebacteria bacterium]|nr:hypothetical protein [Candidatus Woesebacteria bacterium]
MSGKNGICHICGKQGILTYEHVPPKAAFNKKKVTVTQGGELPKIIQNSLLPKEVFKSKDIKKIHKQRGMGGYTLCEKCNTFTGHFYADAFVEMIRQAIYINHSLGGVGQFKPGDQYVYHFRKLYPLRIIKEIFAMFFSVNNNSFFQAHSDLQHFILNKDSRYLDKDRYAVYAHILSGVLLRYSGVNVILNTKTGLTRVVSEVPSPPFGFVLEIEPSIKDRSIESNIIEFATYKYNDKVDITLTVEVKESNYYYPLDYRSNDEIITTRFRNRLQSTLDDIAKEM